MSNNWKQDIKNLIKRLGRDEAGCRLIKAGIPIDTAYRMICGSYTYNPKEDILKRIQKAVRS